jgi:hypothetical protein
MSRRMEQDMLASNAQHSKPTRHAYKLVRKLGLGTGRYVETRGMERDIERMVGMHISVGSLCLKVGS